MQGKPEFERLIRFTDVEGSEYYGDLPVSVQIGDVEGTSVSVLSGDVQKGFARTPSTKTVEKVSKIGPFLQYQVLILLLSYSAQSHKLQSYLASGSIISIMQQKPRFVCHLLVNESLLTPIVR